MLFCHYIFLNRLFLFVLIFHFINHIGQYLLFSDFLSFCPIWSFIIFHDVCLLQKSFFNLYITLLPRMLKIEPQIILIFSCINIVILMCSFPQNYHYTKSSARTCLKQPPDIQSDHLDRFIRWRSPNPHLAKFKAQSLCSQYTIISIYPISYF